MIGGITCHDPTDSQWADMLLPRWGAEESKAQPESGLPKGEQRVNSGRITGKALRTSGLESIGHFRLNIECELAISVFHWHPAS